MSASSEMRLDLEAAQDEVQRLSDHLTVLANNPETTANHLQSTREALAAAKATVSMLRGAIEAVVSNEHYAG